MVMELRVVKFATSKNLVVRSNMFPHHSIHKYTWTSPDGKKHNRIVHILIDRRRHSSVLDIQSFRGADCDTNHCLVIAKVRERLAVSKQPVNKMDVNGFNLKKLNDGKLRNSIRLQSKTGFHLWRTWVIIGTLID
jgi:hypothetical protein